LKSVSKKYPKKSDCAQEIANILNIDKMSVYRRLRGKIKFTIDEMALVASKLDISLDKIMDESPLCSYKFTRFKPSALSTVRKLDLEEVVTSGAHKETGNKFDLYCSSLSFDTSRTYMSSENFCLYHVGALIIRSVYSIDEVYSHEMKIYINSLKDAAILISGSAEKERIRFFNYQREAISIL